MAKTARKKTPTTTSTTPPTNNIPDLNGPEHEVFITPKETLKEGTWKLLVTEHERPDATGPVFSYTLCIFSPEESGGSELLAQIPWTPQRRGITGEAGQVSLNLTHTALKQARDFYAGVYPACLMQRRFWRDKAVSSNSRSVYFLFTQLGELFRKLTR